MLYTSGFMGGTGVAWTVEGVIALEPEVWTRLPVEHAGIGVPGEPCQVLYGEVYLSNPRDIFIVPLKLKLAGGGTKYCLDEFGEYLRWTRRTWDRRRQGFPGMLRALQARVRRARQKL
jgi:hypothetical protein